MVQGACPRVETHADTHVDTHARMVLSSACAGAIVHDYVASPTGVDEGRAREALFQGATSSDPVAEFEEHTFEKATRDAAERQQQAAADELVSSQEKAALVGPPWLRLP